MSMSTLAGDVVPSMLAGDVAPFTLASDMSRKRRHVTWLRPRWQVTCRATHVAKRTATWLASIRPRVYMTLVHVSLFYSPTCHHPVLTCVVVPIGPHVPFLLSMFLFHVYPRVSVPFVPVSFP